MGRRRLFVAYQWLNTSWVLLKSSFQMISHGFGDKNGRLKNIGKGAF
jgi:hypothetical protein